MSESDLDIDCSFDTAPELDDFDIPLGSQTYPGYLKATGGMDPGGSDGVHHQQRGSAGAGSDPPHDPQFQPQDFREHHPSSILPN
jgi:hypothetical protein